MIGLRTPRRAVANCISLLNKVKENIDAYKLKIKKDREEVESKTSDIAPLKVVFASLDGILSDFNKIYPGDIMDRKWDYLFPQIIQSLIDVSYFMKKQFVLIEGFHPGVELPAFISFKNSIRRIERFGAEQDISLVPTASSGVSVVSKISDAITSKVVGGLPDSSHPGVCPSLHPPPIPQNQSDWIKLYGGIYKITPLRGIIPNAQAPYPYPTAADEGFMTFNWGSVELDRDDATYGNLGEYFGNSIAIECLESTKHPQRTQWYSRVTGEYAPNNQEGGCGRDFGSFVGYYSHISMQGPGGTVLIYPVNPDHSGTDWVRYSYDSVGLCGGCCYIHLGNLTFLEGSGEEQDIFNLKESAMCNCSGSQPCPQNCVTLLDEPHYYYVFFDLDFNEGSDNWVEEIKLIASDAEPNDFFGYSVSVSGETVVIGSIKSDGSSQNSGSLYIYSHAEGSWQETKIYSGTGQDGDYFGAAVDIDGVTIVVGAPNADRVDDDDNVVNKAGFAYIYSYNGTHWEQKNTLETDFPGHADRFGSSVAVSGDVIVVGCEGDNIDDVGNAGSAYIYEKTSTWTQVQKITSSDSEIFYECGHPWGACFFGRKVEVSGGTIAVGDDCNVYIYRRSPRGKWEHQMTLEHDCSSVQLKSISIDGEWMAIGVRGIAAAIDDNVHLYHKYNGSWFLHETLIKPSMPHTAWFGYSVSLEGDTLVVGTPRGYENEVFEGAAFIYRYNGTGWVYETKIRASDHAGNDYFGWSVGVFGDRVVSGSYLDDNESGTNAGGAYVFKKESS